MKYNDSQVEIDFDTVRRIALQLPGVEASTTYGSNSLKIRGKLLACIPSHKSAEPGSLVVRIPFDQRVELMGAAPDVYYLPDHYVNYPSVLVRLSRIRPDELRDLLERSWRFVTSEAPRGKRVARARKNEP